jgi:hypothetical protein
MYDFTQIWIIKFVDALEKELPGLRGAVRVAGTQDQAVERAELRLNTWLRANPGLDGSYTITALVERGN